MQFNSISIELHVASAAQLHAPRRSQANMVMSALHQASLACRNDTAAHRAKWVPAAAMKHERGSLAAVTVGDYIYAVGGGKPNIQYESVER